jgi:hypothetical protein
MCMIHVCNAISLTRDMQKMSFVGVLQTIILIVKLGSFGHNSFEYWTYLLPPCPWVIIPMRVMGNCQSLVIILLYICSLGSVIFAWSILSWMMHRNFSFDRSDFVRHAWYNFLHIWYKMYFLSFISYSITLLLCFPNLDIKSLNDSQIIYFMKTNPHFCTSTLKWCIFLKLFILSWEIHPMFISLIIYNNANKSINQIKLQENGCPNNWMFPNIWSFFAH